MCDSITPAGLVIPDTAREHDRQCTYTTIQTVFNLSDAIFKLTRTCDGWSGCRWYCCGGGWWYCGHKSSTSMTTSSTSEWLFTCL